MAAKSNAEVVVKTGPACPTDGRCEPFPTEPPVCVLLVEDNDATRESLGLLLRRAGFDIREARTGADALRLATDQPDLIILDIHLPDVDGLEVCRRVKADPATATIPVLCLSGTFIGGEDRIHGLDSGADGYLTKPIDPPELIATVKSLLRLRRVEQAYVRQARHTRLSADVVVALNQDAPLRPALQRCAEAVVRHLETALVRIWTLNPQADLLELQASAVDTHLDSRHSRVPVGQLMIERIAQERRRHLTNRVIGDPDVPDQEWARREGLVAFAGYPLLVKERVTGVLALFARQPLAADTLAALGSVADTIALGIERKLAEETLQRSAERIGQLERELQAVERLAGRPAAGVTAEVFGALPLRTTHPDLVREWVRDYERLLDCALEQRKYKITHNLSEGLRALADRLGFMRAGPRDVVDIHSMTLKMKTADVTPQKAGAYVEEGRLLVLELMGHVVSYYRAFSAAGRDTPCTPSALHPPPERNS